MANDELPHMIEEAGSGSASVRPKHTAVAPVKSSMKSKASQKSGVKFTRQVTLRF